MVAKEYLKQLKKIKIFIDNKKLEKESIKNISAVNYSVGKVSQSIKTDGVTNKVIAVEKIDEEIEKYQEEYDELYNNIMNIISKLPYNENDVLIKRYVLNMPYYTIANITGYSQSHIKRLHRQGLNHLQDILDKKELSI